MSTIALDQPRPEEGDRRLQGDLLPGGLWALLALSAEFGLWMSVYRQVLDIAAAVILHVIVVAVIGASIELMRRRHGQVSPLLVLLALSTALMGPVGTIGTMLTCIVRNSASRESASFEEWYSGLFPEEVEVGERHAVEKLAENVIAASGRVSIGPLLDVFSHGTRTQKQLAIGVLTRKFHPSFAPALRIALNDLDSAVRVQAATSMTVIENEFLKQTTALEQAVADAPGAPEAIKALARHHDDYAHTGLLDPLRERRSRMVALKSYFKYLRLNPNDGACRLAAARLLYHRKRYAMAATWIEQCIQDGSFTANMAPWYMDCLYKLRRFAELRVFTRQHQEDLSRLDLFPVRVMETARLWSSDDIGEMGRLA
jgi:hypothetical protein